MSGLDKSCARCGHVWRARGARVLSKACPRCRGDGVRFLDAPTQAIGGAPMPFPRAMPRRGLGGCATLALVAAGVFVALVAVVIAIMATRATSAKSEAAARPERSETPSAAAAPAVRPATVTPTPARQPLDRRWLRPRCPVPAHAPAATAHADAAAVAAARTTAASGRRACSTSALAPGGRIGSAV